MDKDRIAIWGAIIVSALVLAYIGVVLVYMLFLAPVPIDTKENGPLIIGCIISMASAAVGYWLGSSVGSSRKDATISKLTDKS